VRLGSCAWTVQAMALLDWEPTALSEWLKETVRMIVNFTPSSCEGRSQSNASCSTTGYTHTAHTHTGRVVSRQDQRNMPSTCM
jgi:hypothetical protein